MRHATRRFRPFAASSAPLGGRIGLVIALLAAAFPSASGAEPSEPELYAFIQQTESVTKLPVVKDIVMKSRSVALVELRRAEGRVRGAGSICSLELVGSSSLVQVTLPDAFVRSVPRVQLDAKLSESGGRVAFEQAEQTLVVGAQLEHPRTDELPVSADDARVIDQDRDGRPGVTVRVGGIVSGEVFVVQRSKSRLIGWQTASGFSGQVRFKNEQSVLGASSPFLKGNRPGTPNLDGSWFRLERLPRGSSCAQALAKARKAWK